jgi:hypothetical protein
LWLTRWAETPQPRLRHINEAYKLQGKKPAGRWGLNFVGDLSSTALNADGFMADIYPYGSGTYDMPMVFVTYKVSDIPSPTGSKDFLDKFRSSAVYDPDAGYRVYHLNYDSDTWT